MNEIADFKLRRQARLIAERLERYGEALEAYKLGDESNPALKSVRVSFGLLEPAMNFPEFLAHVATTGELN